MRISALVAAAFCVEWVVGALLPVSTFNEISSIRTREENVRRCLQPTSSVELYYMEESQNEIPYIVQVTASHRNATYVSVEKLEHLLTDLTCSPSDLDNSTTLLFIFDNTEAMAAARSLWSLHTELLFITHHATCNSLEERAVYKASTITYDLENLTAIVTARLSPLGKSPEASSNIRLQAGPMNAELRKKLRRRASLEEHSAIAKRDLKTSQWIMDLNQNDYGRFAPRENIIAFNGLNITCVNCALKGKVAAYFDLDIDFGDMLQLDFNPFNTARIRLEALEAIDGDFNIEIAATANLEVKCSFPGRCSKAGYTGQGKKFQPKGGKKGNATEIAGFILDGSFSLGLAVDFKAKAGLKVTIPINVDVAKNRKAQKDFFNNGISSGDLTEFADLAVGTPDWDGIAGLCGSIALGPAVTLEARLSEETYISVSARLDLPRLTFCAELTQDVDGKCKPQGPFKDALKLSAKIGAGLVLSGEADTPVSPQVSFNNKLENLYFEKTFAEVCYDISGGNEGNPKTLPPSNDKPKPKDQPIDDNFGTGRRNTTTPGFPSLLGDSSRIYDCSGVSPSPGGQPCGNVIMQCPTLSSWSCGNGQQGIVPPGTFCACGAFRYPGWLPPTAAKPTCTKGIVCVSETQFSVCSPAGIEPPQVVAPGTRCRSGEIVAA